jgi:hypothetical protein
LMILLPVLRAPVRVLSVATVIVNTTTTTIAIVCRKATREIPTVIHYCATDKRTDNYQLSSRSLPNK